MLKNKTALILGAGASKDYGMPLGEELLDKIRDECVRVEKRNYDNIASSGFSTAKFVPLRQLIDRTSFRSIDALLSSYPDFNDVGKFLISLCLLPCEHEKPFYDIANRPKHWMLYLFERMDGALADHFFTNDLTVITFNYDRSFEYFIRRYVKGKYNVSDEKTEQLVAGIKVIHVHGQLGSLADIPFGQVQRQYGAGQLAEAARGIKIIHEVKDQAHEFGMASQALQHAHRIGILGFGFHKTNIERLRAKEVLRGKRIYATAVGMSEPEIHEAKVLMQCDMASEFKQMNCHDLLKNTELLF